MSLYTFNTGHDSNAIPGPQGPAGPQGETGATGADGPQGDPGVQGETGATGADGPQGDPGVQGETGATGADGPQGETGATGADGPQGEPGEIGPGFSLVGTIQNTTAYQLEGDSGTGTWRFAVSGFTTSGTLGETGLYIQNPPFVTEDGIYPAIPPGPTLYENSLVEGVTPGVYTVTATLNQAGLTFTISPLMSLDVPPTLDIYGYNVDETNTISNVNQLHFITQGFFYSSDAPYTPSYSETVVSTSQFAATVDYTHIGVEVVLRGLGAVGPPEISFTGSQRFTFTLTQYQG